MNTQTNTTEPGRIAESTRRPAATTTFRPAADIVETEQGFTVQLDMPGCSPDGIEITHLGNELTVRGRVQAREPAGTTLAREYGVGDFARSFRLGEGIDASAIDARYAGGVLTLTLPKAQATRTRKIDVRTN